jgi:hypothetical protein
MKFYYNFQSKFFSPAIIFLSLMIIFCSADICRANGNSIESEIAELKARVRQLEEKLNKQEKMTKKQESKLEHIDTHLLHREEPAGYAFEGFKIGAGATIIGQGTIDANNANKEDVIDMTYSADIEIEKEFEDFGLAFIHLEAGGGEGPDGDEVDLFSNVNRDAGDTSSNVQVTEAWYEHYLLDGGVVVTFGKLDSTGYLDSNAIANDETTQFLGAAFRNNTALEFPDDNGPGVRIGLAPSEWLEVNMGFFDDNSDWEDMFKNSFVFSQINIKPNLFEYEGNYRFYLWRDDSEHTELLDTTRDEKVNWGWGISLDQRLIEPVTIFARYGWADERVSNVEWAWSTGLQLSGNIWNRDEDVLGTAFGQNIPGGDYGKAGNPDHHETHFEAYYNLHLNDHLSISPDLQVIWNPKGVASNNEGVDDTIKIIGLRAQIDL